MSKLLAVASAVILLQTASMSQASGISFNINVGGPAIVVSQPPDFIYPSELGFGVAVGVPYDMFYLSGSYYVYRGGGWYRTSSYGGSWIKAGRRELPPELRRYKIAKIREYRDREYGTYSRDRDHYRGKRFTPTTEARADRRDMRVRGDQGQWDAHGQRPAEGGGEHGGGRGDKHGSGRGEEHEQRR